MTVVNSDLKDATGRAIQLGDYVVALHMYSEIPKYLWGQTGTVVKLGVKYVYVQFDNVHYKRGSKFHYGPPQNFRILPKN